MFGESLPPTFGGFWGGLGPVGLHLELVMMAM